MSGGIKTLNEARGFVQEHRKKGITCPCCDQYVKIYKRKLNSEMALFLIGLYRLTKLSELTETGITYFKHTRVFEEMKIKNSNRNYSLMKHFGLIVEMEPNKNPKVRTSGFWKITQKGKYLVEGHITVEDSVTLLNNINLGYSQERIDIKRMLGTHFNYEELMSN